MNEKINDGGPAFPITVTDNSGQIAPTFIGMSLRDYFAAKAMQSIISKLPLVDREGEFSKNYNQEDICKIHSDVSISAYCYADAMLEAREK